ncbi:sulfite exporter TauE/SafE family protein, partial [Candidatus Woesearchaeota archaeon]|nr:sulfite exporter TauE/SafE family protein [Candidatus Woesearchaeota archaeon]
HHKFDNINKKALKFLIPTALIGGVLGAVFTNSMPSATIKMIFGIYLFIAAVLMFLKK